MAIKDLAIQDYSLTDSNAKAAKEAGLADAHWYQSPVSKADMRELLVRKDGPAIRDTCMWFSLLGLTGFGMWYFWASSWSLLFIATYAVLYASVSDSRWHEASHGTAFKTDWMNSVLYEIASFMVFRESTTWRWSHIRHHTDTIIVGRDPEIASPRPVKLLRTALAFFKFEAMWNEGKRIVLHACGGRDKSAQQFVPEEQWLVIQMKAKVYCGIYLSVIGLALYYQSWLPLFYIGLPSILGSWLIGIYGFTQHAGLAENVTDHRLNSRTVYMNVINRYLYWNMNYHVEHHMYPLVPYHALPRLHELVKADCPAPYKGLWDTWREIIPVLIRQSTDASYFVKRELPTATNSQKVEIQQSVELVDAPFLNENDLLWLDAGPSAQLQNEDVLRVDYDEQTFALYRNKQGEVYATSGICTHGNTHLAEGFVVGNLIECAKHNGRFDLTTGLALRAPACEALDRFKVREYQGHLYLNPIGIQSEQSVSAASNPSWQFKVLEAKNISTFVRELTLEPLAIKPAFNYQPGDYIQLEVPAYDNLSLAKIDIADVYKQGWQALGLFDVLVSNKRSVKRNYSLATNPAKDEPLKLNVRLAFSTQDKQLHTGAGSSYVYSLKAGDIVTAYGPKGNFRIKSTDAEMVYLGGGAGMAPLKSHISYLLETLKTQRKISFWYGARNENEIIYQDYFLQLAKQHSNFDFHVVLSDANAEDSSQYANGFVHQVLYDSYLKQCSDIQNIEFYLCGPPPMMSATRELLTSLDVSPENIAYDEF